MLLTDANKTASVVVRIEQILNVNVFQVTDTNRAVFAILGTRLIYHPRVRTPGVFVRRNTVGER